MQITKSLFVSLSLSMFLVGCATTQQVIVGQMMPKQQKIATAAMVPQSGNSADMSSQIGDQLKTYGITIKPELPVGTQQSGAVDMIVTYSDSWRWDILMYLNTLTVNFYDASSGNLLVTGRWDNSQPHGFNSSKNVVIQLLDEMYGKLVSATSAAPNTESVATTRNTPSATGKLKELESMHKQGLITDAEYTSKKQEILKTM